MAFYRLAFGLLSPLIFLLMVRECTRRHGGWRFLRERMGLISGGTDNPPCRIWFHAASVGEVNAVLPLVRHAASSNNVLVTTNTPESARLLEAELGSSVAHCYCPVDFAWAYRRLINRYAPRHLFVVETELWPNLFAVAAEQDLTTVIINGRLSQKTLAAPRWVRHFYRLALQSVTAIWARSEADGAGFAGLGCPSESICVMGNIKYASAEPAAAAMVPDAVAAVPYVLGASTHEDEEMQLAGVWMALDAPPLLVLLPRHPTRGDAVVQALRRQGYGVAQRSKGERLDPETRFYVADTVGELVAFAAGARWVFMGGSIAPVGGHNLLEPAALGKAIVTGPSLHNFQEEADYLASRDALIIVPDITGFRGTAAQLLSDEQVAAGLGERARAAMDAAADVFATYRRAYDACVALSPLSD